MAATVCLGVAGVDGGRRQPAAEGGRSRELARVREDPKNGREKREEGEEHVGERESGRGAGPSLSSREQVEQGARAAWEGHGASEAWR